jgi:hypothetical protein
VQKNAEDDGDPLVILKVGAKMKKARLTQFKNAIKLLGSILTELEGKSAADKGEEGKSKVSKGLDEEAVSALIAKGFETLEAKIGEAVSTAVKPLEETLEAVTKRVDDIDAETAGNGDADADEADAIAKNKSKKQDIWAGVIR